MENLIKSFLKKIKLNESVLSTILGGLVIIIVGILILNYFKTDNKGDIALQESNEESSIEFLDSDEEISNQTGSTYTVEAGESLWKISEKFYQDGYKWVEIAKVNNLTNPDYLQAGTDLKLPQIEPIEQTDEIAQILGSEVDKTASINQDNYKVEKDDYLWEIAIRAYGDGYKWPEIARENNLSNPDYLEIGLELKLPR